jgi:hypothetical protein
MSQGVVANEAASYLLLQHESAQQFMKSVAVNCDSAAFEVMASCSWCQYDSE